MSTNHHNPEHVSVLGRNDVWIDDRAVAQLTAAIRKAFTAKGPTVIEVPIALLGPKG